MTNCVTSPYSSPPECCMNCLQVRYRNPALGNETLLRHVQVEEVERVVDGLDLPDFDEPVLD